MFFIAVRYRTWGEMEKDAGVGPISRSKPTPEDVRRF